MSLSQLALTFWSVTKDYWIIPAGMIALYYYGWFRFNTPDYPIEQNAEEPALEGARLLSPAPPMFTTYRSRYNRYGRRYIAMLEVVFLAAIFFASLIETASKVTHVEGVPSSLVSENLDYRALWALFALTGLLSSAPGLKDVDAWILKKLHQAALIPDEARMMADRLFLAPFVATEAIATKVKDDLKLRDTRRVAEGQAKGTLELKLLRMRWLRGQLQEIFSENRYAHFKIRLDRDIRDVFKIAHSMQQDVRAYFLDQERILPANTPDIDDDISAKRDKLRTQGDSPEKDQIERLVERRELLISRCDSLYYRLCLITALMVFATERTADATESTLHKIGFQVTVTRRPASDWHTVAIITAATLVLMIALNVVFAVLVWWLDFNMPSFGDRNRILFYSVLETALITIAIMITMLVKRYGASRIRQANLVNIISAIAAYAVAASVYSLVQYFVIQHYLTTAPILFAFEQAVVGYFIGLYIDRAVAKMRLSWGLIFAQAGCQFLAGLIAAGLAPPPESQLSPMQGFWLAIISASEYLFLGILISFLFQYLYQSSMGSDSSFIGGPPDNVLGDLRVELRALPPEAFTRAPRSYTPPKS